MKEKPKKLFLQRPLWDVPFRTNVRTGDQSTGPPLGHKGIGPARALNAPIGVDVNILCIVSVWEGFLVK